MTTRISLISRPAPRPARLRRPGRRPARAGRRAQRGRAPRGARAERRSAGAGRSCSGRAPAGRRPRTRGSRRGRAPPTEGRTIAVTGTDRRTSGDRQHRLLAVGALRRKGALEPADELERALVRLGAGVERERLGRAAGDQEDVVVADVAEARPRAGQCERRLAGPAGPGEQRPAPVVTDGAAVHQTATRPREGPVQERPQGCGAVVPGDAPGVWHPEDALTGFAVEERDRARGRVVPDALEPAHLAPAENLVGVPGRRRRADARGGAVPGEQDGVRVSHRRPDNRCERPEQEPHERVAREPEPDAAGADLEVVLDPAGRPSRPVGGRLEEQCVLGGPADPAPVEEAGTVPAGCVCGPAGLAHLVDRVDEQEVLHVGVLLQDGLDERPPLSGPVLVLDRRGCTVVEVEKAFLGQLRHQPLDRVLDLPRRSVEARAQAVRGLGRGVPPPEERPDLRPAAGEGVVVPGLELDEDDLTVDRLVNHLSGINPVARQPCLPSVSSLAWGRAPSYRRPRARLNQGTNRACPGRPGQALPLGHARGCDGACMPLSTLTTSNCLST